MNMKLLLPTLLILGTASAQQTPTLQFTPVGNSAPLRPSETYGIPQGASAPYLSEAITNTPAANLPTIAAPVVLPDTAELKKEVTLTVPLQGLSLSEALTLIGKTTGLNVLTQNLPEYELRSSLGPMPAGEAIETLLNLYAPGVAAVQVDNLLIVGTPAAVQRVQGMTISNQTTEVIQSPATEQQLQRLNNLLSARVIPYSTGTLIISGTAEQVQSTKDLLTRLDNASNVPDQTATSSVRRSIESPNVAAEAELLKALFPNLDFTPLANQNLLIIRAPEEVQKEVRNALDEARTRSSALVTVNYPTTYSAEQLATTLTRAYPAARISAVEGRNIVMVQATEAQQVNIAETIRELQGGPEVQRDSSEDIISRSVRLGYADAKTLAADLQSLSGSFLALSKSTAQNSGLTTDNPNVSVQSTQVNTAANADANVPTVGLVPAAQDTPASNLNIRADERTNSLLIVGPRALVNEVVTAIGNIDVPVQSVRVKLRVYQMNQSDAKALGLNWKVGVGGVSFGQTDGSLSLGYSPSVTPASIEAKLNANLSKGNGRTLIDSQFTALSGQQTKFNNGGELVFRPQSSTAGQNTVQTPAQTYTYGLDITMTPRIAPDGTVVMVLNTTLGNPPIEGILNSINQTKQSLQTTVQIRPGEQVILGGVVTSSASNKNSGVPGLRDIPVLGALFGQQEQKQTDDALLFILEAEEARALSTTAPQRQTVFAEPAPAAVPVKVSGTPNLAPSAPVTPVVPAVTPTGVERVDVVPQGPAAPAPVKPAPANPAPANPAPAEPVVIPTVTEQPTVSPTGVERIEILPNAKGGNL